MTSEKQRGHSQGMYRAQQNAKARYGRDDERIQQLKARAERAEAGLGLGTCKECTHWSRAINSYKRPCKWGWCLLTEGAIENTNWPWRGDPNQKIATQENFGCIKFKPLVQYTLMSSMYRRAVLNHIKEALK